MPRTQSPESIENSIFVARDRLARYKAALSDAELDLASSMSNRRQAGAERRVRAIEDRIARTERRLGQLQTRLERVREERSLRQERQERRRRQAETRKRREAEVRAQRRLAKDEQRRRERVSRARLAALDERSRELARRLRSSLRRWKKCPYCGGELGSDPHADHIYPVSKGGLSTRENMVLICERCNLRKGRLTLLSFLDRYHLDAERVVRVLREMGKDI